jgi:hypothetical protein
MGLPQVRLTTRQMMTGVAVVAVFLGGLMEGPRHYWRCKDTVASC